MMIDLLLWFASNVVFMYLFNIIIELGKFVGFLLSQPMNGLPGYYESGWKLFHFGIYILYENGITKLTIGIIK